jgi:formamidopyrimidine-DNA glycosylase
VPEGLEAEIWRRAVERTVGRTISAAWLDSRVGPDGFADAVVGSTIVSARRAGKVVLVDTDGPTIGLHFGMTGRLIVDAVAPIDRLQYSSGRDDPGWDRLLVFAGGSVVPAIRFNDPRRLGHVSLDPDVSGLGVDMIRVTPARLRAAFDGRRTPIKSALLDQTAVAGLGNMLVDEVLWWAGIDPHRPAGSLDTAEHEELATAIRRRLPIMLRRGGSHTGVLSPAVRAACPPCPRDGGGLRRGRIGGRAVVWCPNHQR